MNQHEIDTADIEVGEKVGWLDRNGEQHYGIVDRLPQPTEFGVMFQVTKEEVIKPVREDRINWREVL